MFPEDASPASCDSGGTASGEAVTEKRGGAAAAADGFWAVSGTMPTFAPAPDSGFTAVTWGGGLFLVAAVPAEGGSGPLGLLLAAEEVRAAGRKIAFFFFFALDPPNGAMGDGADMVGTTTKGGIVVGRGKRTLSGGRNCDILSSPTR